MSFRVLHHLPLPRWFPVWIRTGGERPNICSFASFKPSHTFSSFWFRLKTRCFLLVSDGYIWLARNTTDNRPWMMAGALSRIRASVSSCLCFLNQKTFWKCMFLAKLKPISSENACRFKLFSCLDESVCVSMCRPLRQVPFCSYHLTPLFLFGGEFLIRPTDGKWFVRMWK